MRVVCGVNTAKCNDRFGQKSSRLKLALVGPFVCPLWALVGFILGRRFLHQNQ